MVRDGDRSVIACILSCNSSMVSSCEVISWHNYSAISPLYLLSRKSEGIVLLYNLTIQKVLPSSPVFCCQTKYKGGVQRTEGLILTAQKFLKSFQPLSSETTVSSVSPLYFSATQGRRLQCFILSYKNSSDYNKSKKCVTLLPCARMCDRGGGRRPEG